LARANGGTNTDVLFLTTVSGVANQGAELVTFGRWF
jgi:hypothetical protein